MQAVIEYVCENVFLYIYVQILEDLLEPPGLEYWLEISENGLASSQKARSEDEEEEGQLLFTRWL